MVIETERLILRPCKESDAESLYEYAKDPMKNQSVARKNVGLNIIIPKRIKYVS